METKREHRRLDLTPEEWQRLETLAKETSSRPRSGVNAHQPDWRAMLRAVARDELLIINPEPYQMPPGLDEAVQKIEHHKQRVIGHRKQAQKTPLKLTQLQMELEPA